MNTLEGRFRRHHWKNNQNTASDLEEGQPGRKGRAEAKEPIPFLVEVVSQQPDEAGHRGERIKTSNSDMTAAPLAPSRKPNGRSTNRS
jgi:hypothetical protein